MNVELVLASGSPRRREILSALGLRFTVAVPDVDETLRPGEDAGAAAQRLACAKVSVVTVSTAQLVLAADTIVVLDGDLLGKPADDEEAAAMLRRLSGRTHEVVTGLALADSNCRRTASASTRVTFRELDEDDVAAYVATGESGDKAGAYAIQGFGSALVEHIEGDFFNVMGLPVPAFLDLLRDMGYRYLYGDLRRRAEAGARNTDAREV